jgi:hypothetical protein
MMHKRDELSLRWRYHAGCGALVWQLMFTLSGDLVGQKRFAGSRKALFFCIETLTGHVFLDDFLFTEHHNSHADVGSWFTGLETTLGDLVYCHTFQPNSPEHQGIWALEPRSGEVVWSRPELVFVANLEDEFLVYKSSVFAGFPERHFQIIDPFTGADIRLLGLDSNAVRVQAVQEEVRQQITLPEFVVDGMSEKRQALQNVGVADTIRCECIVRDSFIVAALHEPDTLQAGWNSSLNVWRNGVLVYADSLEEHVDRPGLNNFLIRSDMLYYLKGKEELLCVALS